MFTCYLPTKGIFVTVYAVDPKHDAFLIALNGKFKWVPMSDCTPF